MVVMIMGILLAAAMPSYFNSVRRARLDGSNANARSIAVAVQAIYTRTGSSSYTGLTLTSTDLVKELSNNLPVNECASSAKQATDGGWTVTISSNGSSWTIAPSDYSGCTAAPTTIKLGS